MLCDSNSCFNFWSGLYSDFCKEKYEKKDSQVQNAFDEGIEQPAYVSSVSSQFVNRENAVQYLRPCLVYQMEISLFQILYQSLISDFSEKESMQNSEEEPNTGKNSRNYRK